MTDLRDRLRDADPVANEPALPPDDVAALRRRVLDAAREPRAHAGGWNRTLAIAAAVAVMAGVGIDVARRAPRQENAATPLASTRADAPVTRTQLHFSTPGGTRVVWTLDPAFHLTEKR
jgi:hypothetical protein